MRGQLETESCKLVSTKSIQWLTLVDSYVYEFCLSFLYGNWRVERCSAPTVNQTERTTSHPSKNIANEVSDDSDSEMDRDTFNIMSRLTRNGSAYTRLRKRLKQLQQQNEIEDIDSESIKCIICCERKKNIVLYPCKHLHTCEPCWFMWKVQQINGINEEMLEDSTNEEEMKPKCPFCRTGVDSAEKVRN